MRFSPSNLGWYPEFIEYPNLPADLIEVSDEVYRALQGKQIEAGPDGMPREYVYTPATEDVRAALLSELNAEYERRTQIISASYPPSERESWPVQTGEARALLSDSAAETPWIDAAASARGLDRLELAQRIAAKDDAYRLIHGQLSGTRQRIEAEIEDAPDGGLASIDVTAGWPP